MFARILESSLCQFDYLSFFCPPIRPPPSSTRFPYTTLFRSGHSSAAGATPPAAPQARSLSWKDGQGHRLQRSEEHTSELQSRGHLVCRLLLENKKTTIHQG